LNFRYVATLIVSAGLAATPLHAQQVDLFLGIGTARASSNGQSIDTFGDGTLYSTPALNGVFTDFGGAVFLNKQFGVGFTGTWRAAKDYAGLLYRPSFYVFDGVYQPARLRAERIVPDLRLGIGLASVNFDYDDPNACAQVPGCPASHHLVGHGGIGVRLYVFRHLFLRPAADVLYVRDYFPFGTNWVPKYSMGIGYSFGKE
jgi:hypothetical protein